MGFVKKVILILVILITQIACNQTETIKNSEVKTFDSTSILLRQYYLRGRENYLNEQLDTCIARLNNDTLIITAGHERIWPNGLKIKVFHKKYTGYFFHSDDGGAYFKLKDGRVELENLFLKFHSNNARYPKQDGFKKGDTINVIINAISKVYVYKGYSTRDKMESSFDLVIQ